jgi:hypothetical protein
MLVQDRRRTNGDSGIAIQARAREIEDLKAEPADVVKRTAATEGEHL